MQPARNTSFPRDPLKVDTGGKTEGMGLEQEEEFVAMFITK